VPFSQTGFPIRILYALLTIPNHTTYIAPVAYRGGEGWGFNPPPPRNSEDIGGVARSHEQEEPASRFPFVVHRVLIRLQFIK